MEILTVPIERSVGLTRVPLGFQPVGIAARQIGPELYELAIADYFGPSIFLATVEIAGGELRFSVSRIRGASFGKTSVRIFPDMMGPVGNDVFRAQTVNFCGRQILTSANGGRNFAVLDPPENPAEKWLFKAIVDLPGGGMIHSARFAEDGETLTTIESGDDLAADWMVCSYQLSDQSRRELRTVPAFTYGIGVRPEDDELWFAVDPRSKREGGLYRGDQRKLSEAFGNDLAFLPDGSAFVTQYRYESGAFGEQGMLLYIPRRLLNR